MPINLDSLYQSSLDIQLCEETEQKIIDILNNSKLNLRELIWVLAHTLIDIGGSLEGRQDKINRDTAWRTYATTPTLGNALMALGMDIMYDWLKIDKTKEENGGRNEATNNV